MGSMNKSAEADKSGIRGGSKYKSSSTPKGMSTNIGAIDNLLSHQ
jgi:hypothetical protein